MRIADNNCNNRADAGVNTKNHYSHFVDADIANQRSRILIFTLI